MDEQQQRQIDEAAETFADAVRDSYQAVADRAVSAQELNAELAQDLFNGVINNLYAQAEGNREMIQELAEHTQEGQEAGQVIAQASVDAYMDFINSMFFYHQNGKLPSRVTQGLPGKLGGRGPGLPGKPGGSGPTRGGSEEAQGS